MRSARSARAWRRLPMARGREAAGDDAAQLGVLGRVHVEQDDPLHLDGLAGHPLLEPDQRGVLLRGVDVGGLGNREDVGVPGDRPVPLVVEAGRAAALRDPPDRRGAAQLGQLLGGHPGGVDLRVGEVKARRDVRNAHGSLPWLIMKRVLVLIRPQDPEVDYGDRGDRRGGTDPGRQARRRALRRARGRDPGRRADGADRPGGHRAGRGGAGSRRLRDAGGRAVRATSPGRPGCMPGCRGRRGARRWTRSAVRRSRRRTWWPG